MASVLSPKALGIQSASSQAQSEDGPVFPCHLHLIVVSDTPQRERQTGTDQLDLAGF